MKLKKIKRAFALALALAIAGTTNLSGLEGVVKIKAETYYYDTSISQTVNGVTWTVRGTVTHGDNRWYLSNITKTSISNIESLSIKDIVIPDSITNGTMTADITMLDDSLFENTNITSVTLNNNITQISSSCFAGCKSLKTVKTVNNEQVVDIEGSAFNGCTALESVDTTLGHVGINAFYNCEKLKKVKIGGTGETYIGNLAFYGTSLAEINFSDKLSKICLGSSCFKATDLIDVYIPCDCELSEGVFSNCLKLRKLEFNGTVSRNEFLTMYNESCMDGAFENAFGMEYDENGNLIEKEVIFHKSATFQKYDKISSRTRGEFASCSGLTKITFDAGVTIPRWTFYNCINLKEINFNTKTDTISLGGSCFYGCKINNLHFYSKIYCPEAVSSDDDLYGGANSPFYNSNIVNLYITPTEKKECIINISSNTLENVYFGENVSAIAGSIAESPLVNKIIIENPYLIPVERNASDSAYSGKNTLKDTLGQRHYIIGYSSSDISLQNVEMWVQKYSTNGVFSNMIQPSSVKASDITCIGEIKKEDLNFDNIKVTYSKYDDITKELQATPSTDNTDINGYILDTTNLPELLKTNGNERQEYIYRVSLCGELAYGKIIIEPKKVVSLNIDWKENEINQLVSNQPITVTDVISGASVTYNDRIIEYVTTDQLTLNKTATVAGDNTFVVTLNGTDVTAQKTFTIKENYITAIKAEYNSDNTIYVGDKINTSKIKVTPTYKYDEDQTVNRDIAFTKLSQSQLTKEGSNEITVYYNDLETTMVVSAAAVVPTNIYAMFDTNCKYYEGQENIDPKSILVTIEYNNGSQKTGADIAYAYEVTKIQAGTTTIQAKVSYAGLERVIEIPVTPREITGIKASANIASATEGTTLSKTIIDKIEITYNNGKTETLDASTIDYNSLTFNHYVITANTQNTITVNYAGKTSEITIWGVSNSVTRIYAEYIGSGQIVGTQIPTSDVAVHAINANGQIINITEGILLENAIPYTVGPNTVTVHYGSFSCTIIVTGLPAPAATTAPSINLGTTEAPATSEPVQTNKPVTTVTETPSSTTVVSTPNTANSAPVVTNSPITINANNNKITTATNETYKIYTNKNVILTINAVSASAIKYQVVTKGTKVSDTAWKDVTNNKIIVSKTKKPSIVYIQYTDANGMVQTIHTNGFTIDKKKATVNVKKNKTYKTGKKVTFKDASGIKSAKLDGKKIKSGVKVQKKGTHTLVVTDKAGNKTTIKFKVK